MKKFKKSLLFSSCALPVVALPTITACTAGPLTPHDSLVKNLKDVPNPNGEWTNVEYAATPYKSYHVFLRNPDLKDYVVSKHTRAQLAALQEKLKDVTHYEVTKYETAKYGTQYFIPAAQISSEGAASYTSIWVRDSVWNILALKAEGRKTDADNCTKSLFQYFRTDNQIARADAVMKNPEILAEAKGAMKGLHIRFDAHTLEDVIENGQPQYWSHKQNDALGLYLSLFADFAKENIDNTTSWPSQDDDMEMLIRIVAYLNNVAYWNMEDSGAWEEIEKIACSSVFCVAAGLQAIVNLYDKNTQFQAAYDAARAKFPATDPTSIEHDYNRFSDPAKEGTTVGVRAAINEGFLKTINPSVEKGGESIRYPKSADEYREGDAALLNLIYPYSVEEYTDGEGNIFDTNSKYKILEIVESNNNDYGVLRYANDNYQCSDYWFANIPADVSEESYKKRKLLYLDGSEASWFFDSWMAICYGKVIEEARKLDSDIWTTRIEWMKNRMYYHINKAIAFVNKTDAYRSDGTKTTEPSLPESYTVVTANRNDNPNDWYRLASAVDPLRWAQSSMTLMFKYLLSDNSPIEH